MARRIIVKPDWFVYPIFSADSKSIECTVYHVVRVIVRHVVFTKSKSYRSIWVIVFRKNAVFDQCEISPEEIGPRDRYYDGIRFCDDVAWGDDAPSIIESRARLAEAFARGYEKRKQNQRYVFECDQVCSAA